MIPLTCSSAAGPLAVRVGPYVPAVNRLTGRIHRAANAIELKDHPVQATTDRPVS